MKKTAIFVLLVTVAALAKQHTYDFTGAITGFVYQYNYEAHSTVGNTTVDAYCNATNTSVDCHDTPGLTYIQLADGSKNPWPPHQPARDMSKFCAHEKYSCDPLYELISTQHSPIKFQYRLAVVEHFFPAFCVARTDSEGIRKHKEACYMKGR
jgi:hypothetical protein